MKVITLLENSRVSDAFICKHGLSLYIETKALKILFDTGSDDSFAINAKQLGVDLEEVDLLVISHGHYDHGGGLEAFLKVNKKAKIYIGPNAFAPHYIKLFKLLKHSIGIKKEVFDSERFITVTTPLTLAGGVLIFGNVKGNRLLPEGNKRILKMAGKKLVTDTFEHEINLIIEEGEKLTLFCGCSHNGILNIIDEAKKITEKRFSTVIGGMHLMDIHAVDPKNQVYLDGLSLALEGEDVSNYYTCHCTGATAYNYLSQKVTHMSAIKTGMTIEV